MTVERLRPMWVVAMGVLAIGPGLVSAQAPPPSNGPPARVSWTSDAVEVRQGDLVTILIDEFTVASANRDELSVNQRDRNVGLGGSLVGASLRSSNDRSARTQGQSARRERFQAEMSARVVEILPNGIARIEGIRRLMIDEHEQEVTVRGVIRTQDVSTANTIESWRVADAELLYDSNDALGSDDSIWSRLFNLILP